MRQWSKHLRLMLNVRILCSLLGAVLLQQSSFATTNTYQFIRSDAVCDWNPLKGFLTSPSWGNQTTNFPISLEFYYIPLRNVMINLTAFSWEAGLEPLLDATKRRKRHSIIRFYIDYPTKSTGVPQFLIDQGLQFNSYGNYGGGDSPDYTNLDLKNAFIHFITAFGNRYDGDPRIAVIQLGLLGFWGEWHTYPHEDWKWSATYEDDIMKAWDDAFSITQLNVRYASTASVAYRLGYHDDSFAYATYDVSGALDWFFYTQLVDASATEQWQSNIMGGEIYPDLQSSLFTPSYTVEQYAQNWDLCVNITHSTYMLNARAYETEYDVTNGEYDNALNAMRSLGYFIYLDYVMIEDVAYNQVQMDVNLINDGIAPFYYDLKLIITIANDEVGYQQIWNDNSLCADTFGAKTNHLLSDILITFDDQDLIHYFGDETSGDFDAVFNVSLKLYSSMVYEDNPIRLCNTETDTASNIGSIRLANVLRLNGNVEEDSPSTTVTATEAVSTMDPSAIPSTDGCSARTMIATFVMIAIEILEVNFF